MARTKKLGDWADATPDPESGLVLPPTNDDPPNPWQILAFELVKAGASSNGRFHTDLADLAIDTVTRIKESEL